MKIRCIWEHNGNDSLLFAENRIGAFTRGATLEEALDKLDNEIRSYAEWCGEKIEENETVEPVIVQEKVSELCIADADSDIIFESEKQPMLVSEYRELKALVMRSATDFDKLYRSIPDKNKTNAKPRTTFYGQVPRTANEMYNHVNGVNYYYFDEMGIDISGFEGDIVSLREKGFELLEAKAGFLNNETVIGADGEEWSVKKLMRRFIWHDRIHAKAMVKAGLSIFGYEWYLNK